MSLTTSYFKFYDSAPKNIVTIDQLLTDDIKIALLTSSYTPNAATHEYYDVSITNELTTANGYTAGGLSLASKTLTATGTPGEYIFSSTNPSWSVVTANITAHYYILYNNTPSSNKPLLGFAHLDYNSGTPASITQVPGYDLVIQIGVNGFFKVNKTDGI